MERLSKRKDSIQVNLDKPYADAIRKEAEYQFRTYSDFCRLIVMDYIKKNNLIKKHGIVVK